MQVEAPNQSPSPNNNAPQKRSRSRTRIGPRGWSSLVIKGRELKETATTACTQCRRKKIRCSSDFPTCALCERRGLACVYEQGHPDQHRTRSISRDRLAIPIESPTSVYELPPTDKLLRAFDVFHQNYASNGLFTFLHPIGFAEDLRSNNTPAPEVVFAMLCMTVRFCPESDGFEASSIYCDIAYKTIYATPEHYTIPRMQAYLLLALYDCMHADGSESRGWLSLGNAIRIGQILHVADPTGNLPPEITENHAIHLEARRRTFWSAFLLECLLCDGQHRLRVNRHDQNILNLPLPLSDSDWAKGQHGTSATFGHQSDMFSTNKVELDLRGSLIRIGDLFGQVITFINSGGKGLLRRPPWDPESSFGKLDAQLEAWHASLAPFNQYTDANAQAHAVIGSGQIYGFMHILYHTAVGHLHRDFIPFLPTAWNPAQPILDEGKGLPPFVRALDSLLPYQAWFLASRDKAFASGQAVVDITSKLSLASNPFCGFAILSAATLHAMAFWNPEKYGLSDVAPTQARLLQCARFLSVQSTYWPIAITWTRNLTKLYELYGVLRANSPTDLQDTVVRQGVVYLLPSSLAARQNRANGNEAEDASNRPDLIRMLSETSISAQSKSEPTLSPYAPQTLPLPFYDPLAANIEIDDYLQTLSLPPAVDWSAFSTFDSFWFASPPMSSFDLPISPISANFPINLNPNIDPNISNSM